MRPILVLGIMAMLGLAAGCRTINRGVTESVLERATEEQWQVQYGSRVTYTLTTDTLTDVEFEGSVLSGDVVARYQRGLKPQAQCLAERMSDLISQVSERTGVAISTRPTMYLLRFDQRPQNFTIMLAVEPNEFPLPLFVQVGDESCEAIIAQNHSYPYLVVHELVESSLVSRAGGRVLPDISWRGMGLNVHINNCTRWFRDGLANYAGYVAYEIVSSQIPSEQRLQYRQTLVHANPFTCLAEIRDKLFTWPQSPATGQERAYYNAALGLFLLIADTYGQQSIRYIAGEIAQREVVDGKDLIEIANRVLGTDVRRLAAEFRTPALGVELDRLSPALALNRGVDLREGVFVQSVEEDGVAAKAGLKERDVIVAIDSAPTANLLDFELGVFRARRRSVAELTVFRQGAGALTITLPVETPPVAKKDRDGRSGHPGIELVEVGCQVSSPRS
jgi:hypothetical protein